MSKKCVIFNDGLGLDVISWILSGEGFPDNLNGTDFTAALLDVVPIGTRIFLFGARPNVGCKAAAYLTARYGLEISGTAHGYLSDAEVGQLPGVINSGRTDLLLVALGNPNQELWMLENLYAVHAPVLIGVGAFLDFTAGAVPRAPRWLRMCRLEWLHRLWQEPGRLWRRYSLEAAHLLLAACLGRAIKLWAELRVDKR